MENLKQKIADRLKTINEDDMKHLQMSKDTYDNMKNDIEDDTVVNIVDEKADSKAQQRFMGMVHQCKKTGNCASAEVKKAADSMSAGDAEDFASTKHKGLPEKVVDENDETKLKMDVQKFLDQLDLNRFETILSKIDNPQEQAEMIAAFGERIGVPRAKLPSIVQAMKAVSENVNPKMKKSALIEYVTKNK